MDPHELASAVRDLERRLRALEIRFYALAALLMGSNAFAVIATMGGA